MGIAKWRDIRGTLNGNYTREQYNNAMTNAQDAIRRNAPKGSQLKNSEIEALAQKWVLDAWRKPSGLPVLNDDIQIADEPTDWLDKQLAAETANYNTNVLQPIKDNNSIVAPLMTPKVFGNYTQADIDKMKYDDAFRAARAAGQKTFKWRVGQNASNKSGVYGTKLASEVTPPNGEQIEYKIEILPILQAYDLWNRTTNRQPKKKTTSADNSSQAVSDSSTIVKSIRDTSNVKTQPVDSIRQAAAKISSDLIKPPVDSTRKAVDSAKISSDLIKPPVAAAKISSDLIKPPVAAAKISSDLIKPPVDSIRKAVDAAKISSDFIKPQPADSTIAVSDSINVKPPVDSTKNATALRDTAYVLFKKPSQFEESGLTSDPVITSRRRMADDGSLAEIRYHRYSDFANAAGVSDEEDAHIDVWPGGSNDSSPWNFKRRSPAYRVPHVIIGDKVFIKHWKQDENTGQWYEGYDMFDRSVDWKTLGRIYDNSNKAYTNANSEASNAITNNFYDAINYNPFSRNR